MLYIFDLGNVIVNLDFTRALGVWSNLSGSPLAHVQQHFQFGPQVERHERGEISDEQFAEALCEELEVNLSYPQFVSGWQAIFIGINQPVLTVIKQLRAEGHRVVLLSNTNQIHTEFLAHQYPDLLAIADHCYFSHRIGLRKPDTAIFHHVLTEEGVAPEQAFFVDDLLENIEAAAQLGIHTYLYQDVEGLEAAIQGASYFA
ncbi:HAD-IA family hydrolase [Rosenbergiella australiborealis]|uniref:HAD-IA family hydrolase n=1 Tax=Rosenbergiella australiborealis TaxID=1544696 RepID=A0ABS5T9X7_9GAMM|nr:HAD-IA family hydrolase [Rosenbergiella australiborealis]MBT0727768.1 HAD-IA family hydrolase [Rosenbergiella australiborealis]